jgi:uncharacterized protein YbjQ (UPF0145 family)
MTGPLVDYFFIVVPVLLIGLGYVVGRWRERAHFRSLARREAQLAGMMESNVKRIVDPDTVVEAGMVLGQAVIATDYFKTFIAQLRSVIGGRIRTYETLMDRARREARCRMLEQAAQRGATEVWNVRQETSNIMSSSRRNAGVSVEVFAYGTAVRRAPRSEASGS